MNGVRIGGKERSLEDLELYIYTLRHHAVVDCLDDSRDGREEAGARRELRAMLITLAFSLGSS